MTSYQISEQMNLQTVLWPLVVTVAKTLAAVAWLLSALSLVWADIALLSRGLLTVGLWSAGVVMAVGAVMLALVFWHAVLCLAGIAVYAWWFRP